MNSMAYKKKKKVNNIKTDGAVFDVVVSKPILWLTLLAVHKQVDIDTAEAE